MEALKTLRQILVGQNYTVQGENVRCALGLSPQRRPVEKAQAMFYKTMEEAKGDFGRQNRR